MRLDDYTLIQSTFNLNKVPEKSLNISQEYRTEVLRQQEDDRVLMIQSTLFTITESSDLIAELLLKYFITVEDILDITDEEIEDFVFERMQYIYINQANEFLIPAHLPPLYKKDVFSPIKSKPIEKK